MIYPPVNLKGMININTGKVFEQAFKKSIPNGVYFLRLHDPANSFNQEANTGLRFSLPNPYDALLFSQGTLYCLELKSTEGTSMSYYSDEFYDKSKKQTFMIKKVQINGLTEASECNGILAGLVLNWRKTNNTYFINIVDFNKMVLGLGKKSFNEDNVITNNGILIGQKLLKVNYKYDIEGFLNTTKLR